MIIISRDLDNIPQIFFSLIRRARNISRRWLFQLVGHVIKGGGIAISGQEQRQLGGGFLEGDGAPPGKKPLFSFPLHIDNF